MRCAGWTPYERIVVALPAGELAAAPEGTVAVAGGQARSHSVREALRAAGDGDPVIVHDAARPLAASALFERALGELESSGADAVIAAVPVADTIKQVAADGLTVTATLDRARLWAVQTPQVFRRAALEASPGWSIGRAAGGGHRRRMADRAGRWHRADRCGECREHQGHDAH